MNPLAKAIDAVLRRTTKYNLVPNGANKNYSAYYGWSGGGLFGGGGYGGENNDLLRTDDGAALAHTLSIAAYRATEARRQAVGSMPWTVKSIDNDKDIATSEDSTPRHLFADALQRVNDELGQSLFSAWEQSMVVTGKAFIEPYKNVYGRYVGLDWLNPLRVHIYAPNGIITSFQYTGDGKSVTYLPDELVYERFPTIVSDVHGLSPLFVAMSRINAGVNIDRFISAFFRNNAQLRAIISPKGGADGMPLSEQEIVLIRNQLDGAKGSDKAFKTLVTPVPFDVHYPEQVDLSKFDSTHERVETAIYTALGVPRPVAGDVDGQRYQASPEALEWFYQNVVIPRCRDIARMVNSNLLPRFANSGGLEFAFDTSEWERLSPTRMAQLEIVERSYQNGALSLNDYRTVLNGFVPGVNIEPLEHGDVFIVPGSGIQVGADQLGALQGKPSYITFQSPQTTIQQAGEMAQDAGINVPTPPPPETNPASEAPAAVVEEAEQQAESGTTELTKAQQLAAQADALAELRTWRKYAKKHGAAKALDFDTQHLEDWQVLRVKHGLADGLTSPPFDVFDAMDKVLNSSEVELSDNSTTYYHAIKDYVKPDVISALANQHALSILAQKAAQATRSDFENDVEDLLIEAVAGNITRVRFGNRLRGLVQVAIGKAYLDGLEDGGISEPELTADDKEWVANFFDEQRKYIINISDAIYKDGRVTEDEIEGKPAMWFNKSVYPSYLEGIASASKNGAFEWVLGNREEHCRSCVKLNGQVRRMSFWKGTIMPKSDLLACRGFNCGCNLVPTRKGISRGRLPNWRSVHVH